ncbi:MAG: MFS transporter [Solirubrobacterales bacterium]|nr:MFS transporter [Solirubrobacterales bacterium]
MRHTVHGRPAAPVLGALLLAALSYALAQTMVAPALPEIGHEYDASRSATAWLLTGYLLSASVCTPLAGKLGDLYGKGRVLTVVLVVFSIGSAICALGSTIGVLIAGRVIQGVAGGVFPLAFGIVNDELPVDRRPVAIGLISAMFGIGGGIGLPLSGVIVDHVDTSWLFWIGLMALPAAAATWYLVPPSPARERTRVDWRGATVLSLGLIAVLYGISKANAWGWDSARVVLLLGGGLVVLGGFLKLQARTPDPLVDVRVLRERAVLATNVTGFLVGVAMFGSFLLVPQFVQTEESAGYGFGLSVTEAGLVMLPSAMMMLIAGPLGGRLGARFGFRFVLALGTILAAASFALQAVAHSEVWHFIAGGVLVGFGISFAFASMANLIVGAVDPREVGIATGINTIMRTVGGAFGAALVTALLTAEVITSSGLPTEGAYTEAFAASAVGCVLALGASLMIPKPGHAHAGEARVPEAARQAA